MMRVQFIIYRYLFILFLMTACGDGFDLNSQSTTGLTLVFSPLNGLVSTNGGVDISSASISLTKSSSNNAISSCNQSGNLASPNLSNATVIQIAQPYTATETRQIDQIIIQVARSVPAMNGSVYFEARRDSNGSPGAYITESDSILLSNISNAGPSTQTFSFSSNIGVSSGETIWFVFRGDASYSNAGLSIWWIIESGTTCSDFARYQQTPDSGASWVDGSNSGATRTAVYGPLFSSGEASVTYNENVTVSVEFDLTTFASIENPDGENGTLTYDVGVSNSSIASYSYTNLSLTQVQSISKKLVGTTFHLRVNLSASGSGYIDTGFGGASIQYKR